MINFEALLNFKLDAAPGPDGSALLTVHLPKEMAPLIPGLALVLAAEATDPATQKVIERLGNKLAASFAGKRSDADGNPIEGAAP